MLGFFVLTSQSFLFYFILFHFISLYLFYFILEKAQGIPHALTKFAVCYPPSHSDYGLQLLHSGEVCIIVSVHLLTVIIFSSLSFDVS